MSQDGGNRKLHNAGWFGRYIFDEGAKLKRVLDCEKQITRENQECIVSYAHSDTPILFQWKSSSALVSACTQFLLVHFQLLTIVDVWVSSLLLPGHMARCTSK